MSHLTLDHHLRPVMERFNNVISWSGCINVKCYFNLLHTAWSNGNAIQPKLTVWLMQNLNVNSRLIFGIGGKYVRFFSSEWPVCDLSLEEKRLPPLLPPVKLHPAWPFLSPRLHRDWRPDMGFHRRIILQCLLSLVNESCLQRGSTQKFQMKEWQRQWNVQMFWTICIRCSEW
jgi:hypothetical protein